MASCVTRCIPLACVVVLGGRADSADRSIKPSHGSAAAVKISAGDRWDFDLSVASDPFQIRFPSVRNPGRAADLYLNIVAGVPGVEREAVWGAPGAEGRLRSAMILPKSGDFTFAFYVGFPERLSAPMRIAGNPKMTIGVTPQGLFSATLAKTAITGDVSMVDGRWHHCAVVRRGGELSLWQDGRKVAARAPVTDTIFETIRGEEAQWLFLSRQNRDRIFVDDVTAFSSALTAEALRSLAACADNVKSPSVAREEEEAFLARSRAIDPPLAAEAEYVPLRIEKDQQRPFAEQHDVCAVAVPWFDPAGRDLICEGTIFGSSPLLYRFLREENGVPIYAPGVPYTGVSPRDAAPWRGKDGAFGICRAEARPLPDGKTESVLIRYRFDRSTCRFVPEGIVKDLKGNPLRTPGAKFSFADLDGDGVDDVLYGCLNRGQNGAGVTGCNDGFPWPKQGNSPWTDVETPYSGIGRGYDVFGTWMGARNVAEVHWAKGVMDAHGELRFGCARPVYVDMPDFPSVKRILTWKMSMAIMGVTVVKTPQERTLVLFGDMDRIASFSVRRVQDGDVYCALPRPLLASGYRSPHNYWIRRLQTVDFDGDGNEEILIDGNPGTIGVLKGRNAGSWVSARARIEGGAICGETLSSAVRYDWDGDDREDVILTDASGWMTFWGGTDDPLVYKGARDFTVGGKPFCLKGGDSGSLQGTVERVWGYVKVIAGKWGDDVVLVTTDICGDLLVHRRVSGQDPLALAPAQPFRHPDGRPFKVAWRSRPDFVPAGFAGVPHPSLLIMDLDGEAAVAIPDADGSLVLSEVRKLKSSDGSNIPLCGINGLWGRGHLELVDWDADGDDDIIFGSNQACQRFFVKRNIKRAATPFLFRNVGTRANPRFADPVPFRLKKSGNRLAFGNHNATPCTTDLNGDGRADLLVSAENGKVYAFDHEIITAEKP